MISFKSYPNFSEMIIEKGFFYFDYNWFLIKNKRRRRISFSFKSYFVIIFTLYFHYWILQYPQYLLLFLVLIVNMGHEWLGSQLLIWRQF